MATATPAAETQRAPELLGQTVVVIGGSSGIGLETARHARAQGAEVILTGRKPEALDNAALDVGALSTSAFDANDPVALEQFFATLPKQIDHVMVTAGKPHYGGILEMTFDERREALGDRILLATEVARNAVPKLRPGGTLLFISAIEGAHPSVGTGTVSTVAAALPALVANLALEAAPVRANLIEAGFIDTPLSSSLLGDDIQRRRNELSSTLPIGRVVGPADVAALAVHIMSNTALTGSTYTIDGGQQLVE
ncbi:MAG TPA: SDR family oxidoreductase [Solirubrobacteraceae bacterium]|jgi:NAD(P)-dependent dehydrogenase (short-subunit alcohol dehydrogenase family)